MRVAHLSTSLHGGAGKAAYRLHKALTGRGYHSEIFTLSGPPETQVDSSVHIINRGYGAKLISQSNTFLQRALVQRGNELVTPISKDSLESILDKLDEFEILHFHNIYNLSSVPKIANYFGGHKKIVFTLHDERNYTGGCHHAGFCTQFVDKGCKVCPQVKKSFLRVVEKSFDQALSSYSKFRDVSFVSPSNWLMQRAKASILAKNAKHYLIRNPVDSIFFKESNSKLDYDRKTIAFISLDLWNPYKGLAIFLEALNKISDLSWFRDKKLLFIGEGGNLHLPQGLDYEQIRVNDTQILRDILLEVDLVVIPSRRDNFPNVIAESLLSGCDLLTSDSGGVSELSNIFNYQVFSDGNPDDLLTKLLSYRFDYDSRQNRIDRAKDFFSTGEIVSAYEHVYSE